MESEDLLEIKFLDHAWVYLKFPVSTDGTYEFARTNSENAFERIHLLLMSPDFVEHHLEVSK